MADRSVDKSQPLAHAADVMRLPEPRGRPRLAERMILAACGVLVALGGRLAYIEVVMRPTLSPRAERQQVGMRTLHARRGLILDRRGRVLAGSDEADSVFFDPTRVADLHDAALRIAPILDQRPSAIVDRVQRRVEVNPKTQYVLLKREVPEVEAEAIRGLKVPGVGTQALPRRRYPMGRLAAHVLGFVGVVFHPS